jgi:hypothetical protein
MHTCGVQACGQSKKLKSPQNSEHTKDLPVLETKQRPGACLACYNNLFIKLEIQGK